MISCKDDEKKNCLFFLITSGQKVNYGAYIKNIGDFTVIH